MQDRPHPLADREANRPGEPAPPSAGLGALAARIAAWTTNGLVTAMVLVAGLGFGRQVLRWWAEGEEPPPPLTAADPFADGTVRLQFAEQPWGIAREQVAGPRESAVAALRRLVAEETSRVAEGWAGDARSTSDARTPEGPAGRGDIPAEEVLLLERLASSEPAAEGAGWALFELEGVIPMAVGLVGQWPWPAAPSGSLVGEPDEAASVALARPHVVTWGIGMPSGERSWAVYAFRAHSGPSKDTGVGAVPAPPGGRRLAALESADGGRWTVFSAQPGGVSASVAAWQGYFEQWFTGQGWHRQGPWREGPAGRQGRFVRGGDLSRSVGVHISASVEEDLLAVLTEE